MKKIFFILLTFGCSFLVFYNFKNHKKESSELKAYYEALNRGLKKNDSLRFDSLNQSWKYLIRTLNCDNVNNDTLMIFLARQAQLGHELVDHRDVIYEEVQYIDLAIKESNDSYSALLTYTVGLLILCIIILILWKRQ